MIRKECPKWEKIIFKHHYSANWKEARKQFFEEGNHLQTCSHPQCAEYLNQWKNSAFAEFVGLKSETPNFINTKIETKKEINRWLDD